MVALAACCNSERICDIGEDYPDIPGLVVFYEFDGNLMNAVADIHHGSEASGVQYVPDHRGVANSAVAVDGDTIRVADHPDLDITGAITIAAWVFPQLSDPGFVPVADKFLLTAYSFGLAGATRPDTVCVMGIIAGQPFASHAAVPSGRGIWSHIAFSYDEATGEGKFYVNGLPAGSMSYKRRIGQTSEDLRIGSAMFDDGFRGAIDKLAIFNRTLTAAEVRCLYAFE
ncbi:MAG: LamG domain-containing protein [bacterium]